MHKLAFCVFAGRLHMAWYLDDQLSEIIVEIGFEKLEAVLFKTLEEQVPPNTIFQSIIIPAGPAPFTQLRILRSIQLGLATGYQSETKMVSMFDLVFTALNIKTGICLLDTRRGDCFFQQRAYGHVLETGVKDPNQYIANTNDVIISDNPTLPQIPVTKNLATTMLTHDLSIVNDLIYGINIAIDLSAYGSKEK